MMILLQRHSHPHTHTHTLTLTPTSKDNFIFFLPILEYRIPAAVPIVLRVGRPSRFNGNLWLLRFFDEMPNIDKESSKFLKPAK
jgi:hypothetical protein